MVWIYKLIQDYIIINKWKKNNPENLIRNSDHTWFSKHKLFGYLFLVLVFAGVVALAYQWQYGQDETANWKTYNNEKYGFEFRYPSTWEVKALSNEQIGFRTDRNELEILLHSNGSDEYIENSAYTSDCDLLSDKGEGCAPIEQEVKKITINNINGYLVKQETGRITAYLAKKDKSVTVQLYTDLPKNEKIFNQILSMFKFTK